MTPYRLKQKLKKHGISQFELARQLGVTRQAVNHVVLGRRKTERIRQAIAKALGLEVANIWPERPKKKGRKAA
jgi:lambda repressor-like predicted transcriptional regulator